MKNLISILLATTAMSSSFVFAQEINTNAETAEFIGTIDISESRRGVQVDDAHATTEINQEEIDSRQATTLADLVDSVPNVALVNGGIPHGASVSVRGLGTQTNVFGTDGKVIAVVNGVASSAEEIYRNGTMFSLEPELFRHVTVNRGPAESFRYSSGAIGGVIEVETKSARDFLEGDDTFSARQKIGYENNGKGALSTTILSFAPTDQFDIIGFYAKRVMGQRKDGDGVLQFGTDFETDAVLLEANYEGDHGHSFKFHISNTSVPQFDAPYSAFSPSFSDVRVDKDIDDLTSFVGYNFNPSENDLVNLDVRLSYKKEALKVSSISTASDIYNTDHNNKRLALRVENESYFELGSTSHTILAGFELSKRERSSEELAGTFKGKNARSAPGGTDESLSFYVTDEIEMGNATLTPQIRYETQTITSQGNDFNFVQFGRPVAAVADGTEFKASAWTGALAAKYDLTEQFSVFGTAAYNENLPILDDLRSAILREQSEKGRTYELGVSYGGENVFAKSDALQAKFTVFNSNVRDVSTNRGVSEIDLKGAELEVSYANSAFYLDFAAGVTDGTTNGTDADFKETPADAVQLTLGKRFFDGQLDTSFELRRGFDRDYSDRFTPARDDSYTVTNVTASYKPTTGMFEGIEFRGAVDNLFDKTYRPYLATRNALGRNIKFSVAKTF